MTETFCQANWYAGGEPSTSHPAAGQRYRHWCLKLNGHEGPCFCCDPADGGYPGGDLSLLPAEREQA